MEFKARLKKDKNTLLIALDKLEWVKENIFYRVKIVEYKKRRSESASRLFHALCDKLAHDQGLNRELMKNQLKFAFGVKLEIKENNFILKGTSKYDWAEMSYLIEMTKIECLENGIDIGSELQEWEEIKNDKLKEGIK